MKSDDVCVLRLNVVCDWDWVSGVLLVMGCCVGCAWHCCYEFCWCMNGASPVGFVLSLFYVCDSFQSAYRAGHSCDTASLRVYNDIVTTVGKSNGSFLVLLDLSAAYDTIDHDNLFYILEKYVGIGGSALRLIRSYFSDRTQSSN